MRNPLTPAGIEPATFQLVAQHLNHCAIAAPSCIYVFYNYAQIAWSVKRKSFYASPLKNKFSAAIVRCQKLLTLQRGVTGTARMLHAPTHSSISRQVREHM